MKIFDWDEKKNDWLKKNRGFSFEDVIHAISEGHVIDVRFNPVTKKYPNQKVFVIWLRDYIHLVPFVESKDKYYLKTAYPSRKAMKLYGGRK